MFSPPKVYDLQFIEEWIREKEQYKEKLEKLANAKSVIKMISAMVLWSTCVMMTKTLTRMLHVKRRILKLMHKAKIRRRKKRFEKTGKKVES